MNEIPILDLDTAGSIDPATDFFPIANTGLDDTFKISRNVFLEITSTPVGITDIQSISNKTLGISNTVTLLDTLFTLQDNADNTKQARFQLSGITTATTRTYTLPNASSTLADISTAQTFTNKTLTSPVITGGSVSNSTVSVDSISEFTVANGVTVDGLNIKDGKLNTNNSVVSANVTDSAITPAKLLAGTGTGWLWQTYTPSWTNLTVGNGTLNYARYMQTGKTVTIRLKLTFGSTTSVSGVPRFSLPVTANAEYVSTDEAMGSVQFNDVTGVRWRGWPVFSSVAAIDLDYINSSANLTATSATAPFTWAVGDQIMLGLVYEAA